MRKSNKNKKGIHIGIPIQMGMFEVINGFIKSKHDGRIL
jgi:hypothetical protein